MNLLRTRSLIVALTLFACLSMAGCFEDKAVVNLNADGSGSFEQTIHMSEQLVVAMSAEDNGGSFSSDAPFDMNRSDLEAKLGGAAQLTSFEIEDQADGSKIITLSGTFADAAAFFASDYVSDTLGLAIDVEADGRAALTWEAQEDAGNGPSLDQLYGLAKGLKAVRQINLPSPVESTQGQVQGNRVEWAMDLTDRDALEATKAMLDDVDNGTLVAYFAPGQIDFAAAPVAAAPVATAAEGDAAADNAPVDTSGMTVKLNTVGWTRYAQVEEDAFVQEPVLNLALELVWPENSRPLAVYPGELTSLTDDQGNSLVRDDDDSFGNRRNDIWEHSDTETFRIEADGPDRNATALVALAGHIRVVTGVDLTTASLDNPATLVGKASTGNEALDALGMKIKSIEDAGLQLEFNEGVEATEVIQKLTATLPGGEVIESNGWGGWANQMTYNFPENLDGITNVTIELLAGETVVSVPFAFDRIELP